jgi:hypothetical protein
MAGGITAGLKGMGARCVLAALALALLAMLVGSASASARGLTTGFVDDEQFFGADTQAWLLRAKQDGSGIIRINVNWRGVTSTKPRNPTNPADPAYQMSVIDSLVQSVSARGMDVMLTAYSAPNFAEGSNPPRNVPDGSWKPDPKAFGQFGQMLAKRYSGNYGALPRVRYFEAWNEPNITTYLTPQWKGKKDYSPGLYRKLLNAFYSGVHSAQKGAKVIGGTTAPFGDDHGHPLQKGAPRVHPLTFLRKLFCLKSNNKPKKCPTKPKLDILSHHPVNIINSPTRSAKSPNDVEVADFHKIRSVMHAAERAHNVKPKGSHPLWATEVWWISQPPNRIGVPLQKHGRWLEQALYLLWKQGASAVINFEIRDWAYDPSLDPRGQPTTGVFLRNGTRKPAYTAWRFPFVTNRKSKKKVGVWGKAPESGKLQIQERSGGGWRTVKSLDAHGGKVFNTSLKLRGKADLRAQIGNDTSLVWPQG